MYSSATGSPGNMHVLMLYLPHLPPIDLSDISVVRDAAYDRLCDRILEVLDDHGVSRRLARPVQVVPTLLHRPEGEPELSDPDRSRALVVIGTVPSLRAESLKDTLSAALKVSPVSPLWFSLLPARDVVHLAR